jgi:ubiquinone/menaquinone biosynthesis C-methylase UbiE
VNDVQYFEWFAPVYDRLVPSADRGDIAMGLAAAEHPVEDVLDLGGGTGRAARVLAEDTAETSGKDALVVDASHRMLVEARGHGLPAVQGDAGQLPFSENRVDAVVITDALHHFPDRRAALVEAARVLRPGGVLVVRDFDPTTVRGRLLVAGEHLFGLHSSFYSPDELAARIDDVGLDARVFERGFGYTVVGVAPTTADD